MALHQFVDALFFLAFSVAINKAFFIVAYINIGVLRLI